MQPVNKTVRRGVFRDCLKAMFTPLVLLSASNLLARLLSVLTALTIVLGMRMMGAMLISSLVIFPALTAMRLFRSFRGVVVCAAVTSVLCFCAGLTISFAFSTPVGATVVAANLTLFLLSCLFRLLRR